MKLKIGDLVDVHPAVKNAHKGLAIVIDLEFENDPKYYTLLWNNGEASIAHKANIFPVV